MHPSKQKVLHGVKMVDDDLVLIQNNVMRILE